MPMKTVKFIKDCPRPEFKEGDVWTCTDNMAESLEKRRIARIVKDPPKKKTRVTAKG